MGVFSPNGSLYLLLLFLCGLLGGHASSSHIQFSDSRLYRLDAGTSGAGFVAAFGDFDSDKFTDLFIVDADQSVRVYLWSPSALRFEQLAWAAVASGGNSTVVSVAAADFDHDGRLDVLVTRRRSSSTSSILPLDLTVYLQRDRSMVATALDPPAADHVALLDMDGDMHVDIYGAAIVRNDTVPGVWRNCFARLPCSFTFEADTRLGAHTRLAQPAALGFVDLDGDCMADRFMATRNNATGAESYEIWLNGERSAAQWTRHVTMPARRGAGAPTFVDVDRDGSIDIVLPVCWPTDTCAEENSIHILFNKQIPLCASSLDAGSATTCRAHTSMCVGDPNFELGQPSLLTPDSLHIIIPRSAFSGFKFAPGAPDLPLTVRAGDIDMNGYVDLLVPLIREGDLGHSNFFSLWRNAACDDSTCGAAATSAGRRTFVRVDESDPAFSVLVSIENAFSGGFFDINEQGAVGILVNSEGASGAASNTIDVLFNNLEADSLFLKAIGLNGVCPAWCATGAKFPSPKPYGVNHPGVTFKFTVADLSGTQHARIGAQLPVSGPQSLLPPYSHHGLGRTNDYVQFFFAGFALTGSQHWQSWPGIIPNSQLVVFPFEPAVVADWTLELLVSPARSLPQVAAAIVIAMAALALSVLYFHLQEKRQDQQEKRKAEHLLTF